MRVAFPFSDEAARVIALVIILTRLAPLFFVAQRRSEFRRGFQPTVDSCDVTASRSDA